MMHHTLWLWDESEDQGYASPLVDCMCMLACLLGYYGAKRKNWKSEKSYDTVDTPG